MNRKVNVMKLGFLAITVGYMLAAVAIISVVEATAPSTETSLKEGRSHG